MKTILIVTEGYSGSLRKPSDSMFGMVNALIQKTKLDVVKLYQNGNELDAIRDAEDFIKEYAMREKEYNIAIIGKSMGAAKSYFLYKELFKDHRNVLINANKILVFTIDPHGKCARDINPIPFSSIRDMKLNQDWVKDEKLKWCNIYQQRKYPKGAKVIRATYEKKIAREEVDHFNIADTEDVKIGLLNSLSWLA